MMAVSKKQRHLSPEEICDFLKGGLERQHLEKAQAHLDACARCAAFAVRGRLILKWLKRWSIQAQNVAYCRVLLRESLSRAGMKAGGAMMSRRLVAWQKNAPARYAGLFSFKQLQRGRAGRAAVTEWAALAEHDFGLRILAPAPSSTTLSPAKKQPGSQRNKQTPPGQRRPLVRIEPEGTSRIVIHGEFTLGNNPTPLVLLVPCRHQTKSKLTTLKKTGGPKPAFQARFAGLAPGRYILAFEPARTWLKKA